MRETWMDLKMHRCFNCGERQRVLDGTGETTWGGNTVPQFRLVGVPRYVCKSCGDETFGVPNPLGLRRTLRELYATKPTPLEPRERRHARKLVGWSVEDTARRLGVTPHRVLRWESHRDALTTLEEVGLRVAVLTFDGVQDYEAHGGTAESERAAIAQRVREVMELAEQLAEARERETWTPVEAPVVKTGAGWAPASEMVAG